MMSRALRNALWFCFGFLLITVIAITPELAHAVTQSQNRVLFEAQTASLLSSDADGQHLFVKFAHVCLFAMGVHTGMMR